MDIARIHIRFFQPYSFVHGSALIEFMTQPQKWPHFHRAWYAPEDCMKVEEHRIVMLKDATFVMCSAVGDGELGRLQGEMAQELTDRGLKDVLHPDIEKIFEYTRVFAPAFRQRQTEFTLLASFSRRDGVFRLDGILEAEKLHLAINPI